MKLATQEKTRKYDILRMLIDEYVGSAEPVGSEVLCAKHRLSWSPATVRNDFSELENEGFLAKPHTSGGRIPTNKAYGRIRDEALETGRSAQKNWDPFRHSRVPREVLGTSPDRCHIATHMLAQLTGHLVVGGILEQEDLIEVGLPALVREPEFAHQETIASVAMFLEQLVDETEKMFSRMLKEPLEVYIGEENMFEEIRACSLLVAGFRMPGGEHGFMGILGPTRMPYERNIAYIEQVADALGKRI